MYELPFPKIDIARNHVDANLHDKMVSQVENMLRLKYSFAAAKTSIDKQMVQHQIETTDEQIDMLVYELYELTEEEIRIVEES